MARWIVVGLLGLGALGALALGLLRQSLSESARDPAYFEASIAEFEEADRGSPPVAGGIVFVGSSSIRFWGDLAEQMAPLPVIRRGFGGAHMAHVLHTVHRIVTPYGPSAVVVYAGYNERACGKPAETVLAEYQRLVEAIWKRLPEARVYFIAIKPSPLRWDIWPEMKRANQLVSAYSEQDSRLVYLDVAGPMLSEEAKPRPELFVVDGLHLSDQGYRVWSEVIRPRLLADRAPHD